MEIEAVITELNGWWVKTVLYTNADGSKGFYINYKETPTGTVVQMPHVGARPDDR